MDNTMAARTRPAVISGLLGVLVIIALSGCKPSIAGSSGASGDRPPGNDLAKLANVAIANCTADPSQCGNVPAGDQTINDAVVAFCTRFVADMKPLFGANGMSGFTQPYSWGGLTVEPVGRGDGEAFALRGTAGAAGCNLVQDPSGSSYRISIQPIASEKWDTVGTTPASDVGSDCVTQIERDASKYDLACPINGWDLEIELIGSSTLNTSANVLKEQFKTLSDDLATKPAT